MGPVTLTGEQALLNIHLNAIVSFLPLIGGFVGADTTAVIASVENDDKARMMIDLSLIHILTSHLPSTEPPHGPFINDFAHLVIGHMPPVYANTQSEHNLHASVNIPCLSPSPKNIVLFAGYTPVSYTHLP